MWRFFIPLEDLAGPFSKKPKWSLWGALREFFGIFIFKSAAENCSSSIFKPKFCLPFFAFLFLQFWDSGPSWFCVVFRDGNVDDLFWIQPQLCSAPFIVHLCKALNLRLLQGDGALPNLSWFGLEVSVKEHVEWDRVQNCTSRIGPD